MVTEIKIKTHKQNENFNEEIDNLISAKQKKTQ